jgi:hypothetical protein
MNMSIPFLGLAQLSKIFSATYSNIFPLSGAKSEKNMGRAKTDILLANI